MGNYVLWSIFFVKTTKFGGKCGWIDLFDEKKNTECHVKCFHQLPEGNNSTFNLSWSNSVVAIVHLYDQLSIRLKFTNFLVNELLERLWEICLHIDFSISNDALNEIFKYIHILNRYWKTLLSQFLYGYTYFDDIIQITAGIMWTWNLITSDFTKRILNLPKVLSVWC